MVDIYAPFSQDISIQWCRIFSMGESSFATCAGVRRHSFIHMGEWDVLPHRTDDGSEHRDISGVRGNVEFHYD